MTLITAPAPSRSAPPRLPRRIRRSVLVVHIASAGAWIGIDVMVAVLVGAGALSDSRATQGLAYEALATFVVWPMLVSALVCLASGLILGLGTKWGLVRYWWVGVKLVMNVVLCVLIVFLLAPGMSEVGERGRLLSAGEVVGAAPAGLLFPPVVSLTALVVATVLSVAKPWGRTRRK